MKEYKIFLAGLICILFGVIIYSCTRTVKPTPQPGGETGKPVSEEKKLEEELIAAKKPGEIKESEIGEALPAQRVEEVPSLQDIHFDFDDYSLTMEAQAILQKNAIWIKAHPSVKILIEGHCDERGTNEYNMVLGEKRAHSAKNYLIKLGVRESQLSTISYGEEKPLDPGHNEEAWAKNRRAHFSLIK